MTAGINHTLDELFKKFRASEHPWMVTLVANIRDAETLESPEPSIKRQTEFYTKLEAHMMVSALRSQHITVSLVNGEIDFLRAVLIPENLQKMRQHGALIYSTAQSGHGNARKSLVPSVCELLSIPFMNSDPYVLSLVRNKFHVYCLLKSAGLPVPHSWLYVGSELWFNDAMPPEGMFVIVKLVRESASVGMAEENAGRFGPSIKQRIMDLQKIYQQPVLVQEFIEGREAEVPLIEFNGWHALTPAFILINGEVDIGIQILDYDIVADDNYKFNCEIRDSNEHHIRKIAEKVAEVLCMKGIGRVDFRISTDGDAYITDVSTTPHLTPHGAFQSAFATLGYSHPVMLALIVAVNAHRMGWL